MKKYIPSLSLMLVGIGFITFGCLTNEPPINNKPVSIEYFKNGQILYPDYACPDTLIVRDAEGLNKAFAYVEQDIDWGTDADCDSLIHVYCDYYIGSFEDQFTKLKALRPTWDSLQIATAINED